MTRWSRLAVATVQERRLATRLGQPVLRAHLQRALRLRSRVARRGGRIQYGGRVGIAASIAFLIARAARVSRVHGSPKGGGPTRAGTAPGGEPL